MAPCVCLQEAGQEVPCFLIWCLWDLGSQVPSTRPFSCWLWSPATPQPGLGPTPGRPLFCNSCLPPTEPTVKLCSPAVQPSAHRAPSLLSQIPCVSRESQGLWCEPFIQRGVGAVWEAPGSLCVWKILHCSSPTSSLRSFPKKIKGLFLFQFHCLTKTLQNALE